MLAMNLLRSLGGIQLAANGSMAGHVTPWNTTKTIVNATRMTVNRAVVRNNRMETV